MNEDSVGPIEAFMAEDHVRIDRLLRASERDDGTIDEAAYPLFRGALLRHIAMEEKVLLPAARATNGETPLPITARLRADHGSLAKLLVRAPTASLLDELREMLGAHNSLEEGPHGLYAECDALMSLDANELVARMRAQPEVPLAKYYDGPLHARR